MPFLEPNFRSLKQTTFDLLPNEWDICCRLSSIYGTSDLGSASENTVTMSCSIPGLSPTSCLKRRKGSLPFALVAILVLVWCGKNSMRAQAVTPVQFNPQSRTFRIDASDMTYAFAINERNELQTVYWGRRIASGDPLSVSKAPVRGASFDTPASTTQQEYSGWGAACTSNRP